MADLQAWFTPEEAAAYLRVSRATIYRLSEEGQLPFSEIEGGRGRRFRGEDVRRLVRPDRSRTHAGLATRFRIVHAELAAVVVELRHVVDEFSLGWEGLVSSPDFWADVRDRAGKQMEAHRDLAVPGRRDVERVLDELLRQAWRHGHRMGLDVRGEETAHAKCKRCGAQLTVGYPIGGTDIQAIVDEAAQCVCSHAVAEVIKLFDQWERAAARSPNSKVASSAPLDPPTAERAAALLPRLLELREQLEERGFDHHNRPMANLDSAALAWLWEEWRDDILGERNGYRDVWAGPDDPLYDVTGRRSG